MNIGTIDNARIVVFSGNPAHSAASTDHRYMLTTADVDLLALMHQYPTVLIKRTTDVYIDDPDGLWFAFANVDCFDPPIAIIRASSFEQAYETFCDEFEKWIAVKDANAEDYPEDDREFNGNGTHIDASGVQGWTLTLVSVEMAS